MIVLQPVVETCPAEGFDLWPVAPYEPYGFLPLSGAMSPAEVGLAVMCVAACNNVEEAPRSGDPLGDFLRGLLTLDDLYAAGGLRVTDTATGLALTPGCRNGLDERGDWDAVLDVRGRAGFGHDPSPLAERVGATVRLTPDTEQPDSPVIELPVDTLPLLLAGAERDLADFLRLATDWAAAHLADRAAPVSAALARALAVPLGTEPGGLG
ncbi:hypothetical protein [Streptomyces laurentii]|uniref:hypothetical protein n=1 Tax=Streptomyces laurentii TaxID=39478 RepID=UPI0033EFF1B5